MADLLFERPRAAGGDLVFGDSGGPTADAEAVVGGEFEPLAGVVFARVGLQANIAGTFEPLTGVVTAAYSSNTQRPTVGQREAPWQVADKPNQPGVEAGHRDAAQAPTGWAAFWERATGTPAGIEHRLPDVLKAAPIDRLGIFQDATGVHGGAHFLHQEATHVPARRDGVFQDATKAHSSTDFRHQDGDRTKRASRLARWQDGAALRAIRGSDFQGAAPSPHAWSSPFQDGVPPPPGLSLRPVDPPKPPGCYTPDPNLLFSWPWGYNGAHLVFQCGHYNPNPEPGETVVVPVKEVYLTINSAVLVRLDNGHPIPTTAMSMSLDGDSWTWSFSASVPGSALADVQPNSNGDPVLVQAAINGTPFRFALERIGRERSFNSSELRVSGRGLGAELDAPYAPQQSFGNTQARTAQQLIADILTVNNVPMDWSVLQWQPTDWLVPAGVFSHTGTYISAINAVVAAAGAYVQPHNTERKLNVCLRYPKPAWQWDTITPDFELPAAVTTQEGFEWVDKPAYNRVFVVGQEHGVLGRYTRSGTAGDREAPTVVDPLITHADAARQRGRAIISDTGRIATVSLRLPVLAETGIIKPGNFVRYVEGGNTHVGITRGVSVAVGLPTIYQTITLETHLEPV